MIKKLILASVLTLTCLVSNSTWSKTTILLLGDSLSASYGLQQKQGWVTQLNQQLAQQNAAYTIINASISGETTNGGLSRLPAILSSNKVDYLLIELGGNDGLRGFPPKLIKNNLLQIIELAQQHKVLPLLMKIQIPPNYGVKYNQLFEQVFEQVATQKNIPLLPFFMTNIATNPDLMQADGIHPNYPAQALIVEFMAAVLADAITTTADNNAFVKN